MEKEIFCAVQASLGHAQKKIAVGVSGGADSMALAHMLGRLFAGEVHVLSVNHGLREEAQLEVELVRERIYDFQKNDGTVKARYEHVILLRDASGKKSRRIQEKAREDRYSLMAEYCAEQKIEHLYLAHHFDDQIETFFFRLAKGSGLQGLGVMRDRQSYNSALTLMRPLLAFEKSSLLEYCAMHNLAIIDDPSNENEDYARVRLRKGLALLKEEGLSFSRMESVIGRLQEAQQAIDVLALDFFEAILVGQEEGMLTLDFQRFKNLPKAAGVRVLQHVITSIGKKQNAQGYGTRLARIEHLWARLDEAGNNENVSFKAATLGGCIFKLKNKKRDFVISAEK